MSIIKNKMTDQRYLVSSQYRNAENLNARSMLHARFSTSKINWFDWVFQHLTIPKQAKILEVGCGTGALWAHVIDKIPPGWQFTLGDLSNGMLQKAKSNLLKIQNQIEFQAMDIQILMFPAESFDAVIANHMLYHVPNIPRAIQEVHRVLKPGGKFYAATNGINHLHELHEIIFNFTPLNPLFSHESDSNNYRFSFNLDNGEKQLSSFFSDINLALFHDELIITEVEPIAAYIWSMIPESTNKITDDLIFYLNQYLFSILQKGNGSLRITKSTGMFEASKSIGRL
jgi:ubiquinone/menaquinone biosynthesis C-methylase UbiE